jgi:hypothetical protein
MPSITLAAALLALRLGSVAGLAQALEGTSNEQLPDPAVGVTWCTSIAGNAASLKENGSDDA